MRSVKSLLAAGAASLISSMAFAADMPIAVPPPMYAPPPMYGSPALGGPPGDFGGWYLRGDIGMSSRNVGGINSAVADSFSTTTNGLGFDSADVFEFGGGYRFNNWFRADLTGQLRGRADLHGANTVTYGFNDFGSNRYSGSESEYTFMANAYVDLGTWWSITPFIGGGIGASYNMISGFRDDGIRYSGGVLSNSVTYFKDNGKWNFSWAAHAGLAYKVNQAFTVELAYSYMDLGSAAPGNFSAFDGSFSGATSIRFRNITSNDVKLGLRWNFDCPPVYALPPPPPLVTKG